MDSLKFLIVEAIQKLDANGRPLPMDSLREFFSRDQRLFLSLPLKEKIVRRADTKTDKILEDNVLTPLFARISGAIAAVEKKVKSDDKGKTNDPPPKDASSTSGCFFGALFDWPPEKHLRPIKTKREEKSTEGPKLHPGLQQSNRVLVTRAGLGFGRQKTLPMQGGNYREKLDDAKEGIDEIKGEVDGGREKGGGGRRFVFVNSDSKYGEVERFEDLVRFPSSSSSMMADLSASVAEDQDDMLDAFPATDEDTRTPRSAFPYPPPPPFSPRLFRPPSFPLSPPASPFLSKLPPWTPSHSLKESEGGEADAYGGERQAQPLSSRSRRNYFGTEEGAEEIREFHLPPFSSWNLEEGEEVGRLGGTNDYLAAVTPSPSSHSRLVARPSLPPSSFAFSPSFARSPHLFSAEKAVSTERSSNESQKGEREMKAASSKAELGRAGWTFLHTLAAQYPEKPTRQMQRDVRDFVVLFAKVYPCKECSKHFQEIVKSHPPKVSSRSDLELYMCKVHNIVNRSLGKPEFPCRNSSARWNALDCEDDACSMG